MTEKADCMAVDRHEEEPSSLNESLTEKLRAYVQTGEPSLKVILKYSNGCKGNFRKLMQLLNELPRNIGGDFTSSETTTSDSRKRELKAQALLRLRLWVDYEGIFTKLYKKKFGKSRKGKKLENEDLVFRDISHLISLVALQLSPQEPFDAFLRHALSEVPGEHRYKQQLFDRFEVLDNNSAETSVVAPKKDASEDSRKPKAKRKKSSIGTSDQRTEALLPIENKQSLNQAVLPSRTRLEITAPIRRNSLIQKSRFVGSHFNSGNVETLFRHVKSSIPANRTISIQHQKPNTKPDSERNSNRFLVADAPGKVQHNGSKLVSEEENKGIFQTNDKPARRRSSLVADALRALNRRDKK
jgi:hypothetical protein